MSHEVGEMSLCHSSKKLCSILMLHSVSIIMPFSHHVKGLGKKVSKPLNMNGLEGKKNEKGNEILMKK